MKARHILTATVVCLNTALSALAAYTPPTDAQIAAAAGNPTQLSALLQGASSEQSAHVVKTVVARLAALNLSEAVLKARIDQAIETALAAVPANGRTAFCALLGKAMGHSMAIRNNPVIVSSTQSALATHMGTAGAGAAKAFGDAYSQAASGSGNAQNTKDRNKAQPPSALLYGGQN